MSYYEPEISHFPRLAENGENYDSWQHNMLAVFDALELSAFVASGMEGMAREDTLARRELCFHLTPALVTYAIEYSTTRDLWTALANCFALGAPKTQPDGPLESKTAVDMKEGRNGKEGDMVKGRGRCHSRKTALRSQDATGETGNRPGDRVEVHAHDAATPPTSSVPAKARDDLHELIAIVQWHNTREQTYAHNAAIASLKDSEVGAQGNDELPGSREHESPVVHQHDEREDTHACDAAKPSLPNSNADAHQGIFLGL